MFGTIMRARVKTGRMEALERHFEEQRAGPERPTGFYSVEFAREDKHPDRVVVVIHFADKESHVAHAKRPEADADYQQLLGFLEGEPEWIDVHYARYYGYPVNGDVLSARAANA
jgi:quinol monooxygenase YgiN